MPIVSIPGRPRVKKDRSSGEWVVDVPIFQHTFRELPGGETITVVVNPDPASVERCPHETWQDALGCVAWSYADGWVSEHPRPWPKY